MNKRTPSYVYTMFKDNQSEGESTSNAFVRQPSGAYVHMVESIAVTLVRFALKF